MCGLTVHSLADLMPLFWSEPVAISDSGAAPSGLLAFMMTVTYLIPVCGILCTLYGNKRFCGITNVVLAAIVFLFNLFHMSELFMDFSIVQLPLLPVILIVSGILCTESWKLMK
jgi:hypothetical protein